MKLLYLILQAKSWDKYFTQGILKILQSYLFCIINKMNKNKILLDRELVKILT